MAIIYAYELKWHSEYEEQSYSMSKVRDEKGMQSLILFSYKELLWMVYNRII